MQFQNKETCDKTKTSKSLCGATEKIPVIKQRQVKQKYAISTFREDFNLHMSNCSTKRDTYQL